MKNLFYLLFVLPLLFSCGGDEGSTEAGEKEKKEDINLLTEEKIAFGGSGKIWKAGYYHLNFKKDHSINIYQSAPGSYAKGCTAKGEWKIEGGKLKIKVTASYCGTNDYKELNGDYTYSAYRKKSNNELKESIEGPSKTFYH